MSQHVTGQHSDQLLFGEVVQGALVDKHGDAVGTVYLDFGGSITGGSGSLSSLWLWIDTPEGQYKYAADGQSRGGHSGRRRLDHLRVLGGVQPLERPRDARRTGPHDGAISISLGFWGDGSLYATSVSMDES